jgi:hypothetical protein
MKKMTSSTINTESKRILEKIKKLECNKEYRITLLGEIGSRERTIISRLADKGVIVKSKRGHFFKPGRSIYKRSEKEIALDKSMFDRDLFWSVGDGAKVNAETVLAKYLESSSFKDIVALHRMFGYSRVLEAALKKFGSRHDLQYRLVRSYLERAEKWRMEND